MGVGEGEICNHKGWKRGAEPWPKRNGEIDSLATNRLDLMSGMSPP